MVSLCCQRFAVQLAAQAAGRTREQLLGGLDRRVEEGLLELEDNCLGVLAAVIGRRALATVLGGERAEVLLRLAWLLFVLLQARGHGLGQLEVVDGRCAVCAHAAAGAPPYHHALGGRLATSCRHGRCPAPWPDGGMQGIGQGGTVDLLRRLMRGGLHGAS